ncbi:hypothetical protein [Hymenobacter coccineus]|uniref:hypothetical protein n=1 Tax=Hymenobacter coccineus TaxID=1908235 RepID=UPI000F778806|nr:hypothetical protein [Hymenobacter coccineus]
MKTYNLAAFISMIVSWFIANISFNVLYPIIYQTPVLTYWIIRFGSFSFVFSLLANIIFVWESLTWGKDSSWIKKSFFSTSRLKFAILLSLYGTLIFSIPAAALIIIFRSYWNTRLILFFIEAAINGFVYGVVFYGIWKPSLQIRKQWITSTTLN